MWHYEDCLHYDALFFSCAATAVMQQWRAVLKNGILVTYSKLEERNDVILIT